MHAPAASLPQPSKRGKASSSYWMADLSIVLLRVRERSTAAADPAAPTAATPTTANPTTANPAAVPAAPDPAPDPATSIELLGTEALHLSGPCKAHHTEAHLSDPTATYLLVVFSTSRALAAAAPATPAASASPARYRVSTFSSHPLTVLPRPDVPADALLPAALHSSLEDGSRGAVRSHPGLRFRWHRGAAGGDGAASCALLRAEGNGSALVLAANTSDTHGLALRMLMHDASGASSSDARAAPPTHHLPPRSQAVVAVACGAGDVSHYFFDGGRGFVLEQLEAGLVDAALAARDAEMPRAPIFAGETAPPAPVPPSSRVKPHRPPPCPAARVAAWHAT